MQQQQANNIQFNDGDEDGEDDEGEGEDEDDENQEEEEDMLIDLNSLDDEKREMLIEYLQQEYDKNPGEFEIPQELLEALKVRDGSGKRQSAGKREELESVKDIKSQEMILEDAMQGEGSHNQIVGGGQDIEDEGDEIQEDDEEGAEYLDD